MKVTFRKANKSAIGTTYGLIDGLVVAMFWHDSSIIHVGLDIHLRGDSQSSKSVGSVAKARELIKNHYAVSPPVAPSDARLNLEPPRPVFDDEAAETVLRERSRRGMDD